MNHAKEIAKQIKRIREAQKLTQKELAERANVTQGEISHIETGRRNVAIDVLVSLLSALECAVRIEEGKITFYKVG